MKKAQAVGNSKEKEEGRPRRFQILVLADQLSIDKQQQSRLPCNLKDLAIS